MSLEFPIVALMNNDQSEKAEQEINAFPLHDNLPAPDGDSIWKGHEEGVLRCWADVWENGEIREEEGVEDTEEEVFVDPWEVAQCRWNAEIQNEFKEDWEDPRFREAFGETIWKFIIDAQCLSCGRKYPDLSVCNFRSPDVTWEGLCGRAGLLVVCDHCRKQVDFFPTWMS